MHGDLRGEPQPDASATWVVVPEAEFKAWYFGGEDAPVPGSGAQRPSWPRRPSQGSPGTEPAARQGLPDLPLGGRHAHWWPTFKGLFGKTRRSSSRQRHPDHQVDEAYLVRSSRSRGEIVKAYPGHATSFRGPQAKETRAW